MRRRFLVLGLLGLVAVLGVVGGSSAATQVAAGWGKAIKVPGLAALNSGNTAWVGSVSCGAAGECAAGGSYMDGSGHGHAFVVSETNGVWGSAVEVPGTAALSSGGNAGVSSVSCAAAGECAAGGSYIDGSEHWHAFVVSETNGVWGSAIEVPGIAAVYSEDAGVAPVSVSCAAAGECAAGGSYTDGSEHWHAFVVSETNGVWGSAVEVPGLAALNSGGNAAVVSVSCAAAGDCAAGGSYIDGSDNDHAFVVSETHGVWGSAIEVPGTAALNTGGDAAVGSVSCAAAGDCAAGGSYTDGSGHDHAFVVSETNGVWGSAVEVPGMLVVVSVSCAAADECAAGGVYSHRSGNYQVFVVSEKGGVWGSPVKVPGTAALNSGGNAAVVSVSCAAAGDCAAGGFYADGSGHLHAFVVSEKNGVWGSAMEVPGTAGGDAAVESVSCPAAGECAAGGFFGSGHLRAFVVNSGPGITPPPCVVPYLVGKTLSVAKKRLTAAYCGLGKVKQVYAKAKKGRVVAQRPRPGMHVAYGAKVALTLSKGKRK